MQPKPLNRNLIMEHHTGSSFWGAFNATLSLISGFIAIATVQVLLTLIATIVGCISGFMAIRYYYFATKKIR